MVIEQEMAEIYRPAEELVEFLPSTDCGKCGFPSCIDFGEALLGKRISPQKCPELDEEFQNLLEFNNRA